MAATADQLTPRRNGDAYAYPVKGATRIFAKTLTAVTATGLAVPAGTVGAVAIVGLAAHPADNRDGGDGAGKLRAEKGAFALAFDTAPAFADIGKAVYAVDDVTVSLDSSSNARLKAGVLEGIEDGIRWVRL